MSAKGGKSVVLLGAGNIGSQIAPHLGRMPGIGRIVVIDHGSYEWKNVAAQQITLSDVGRKKVIVMADRLISINPGLVVEPVGRLVEEVPFGLLRADALVCCLDSVPSRQFVNEAAVHHGVPWIDAGIATLPDGSRLARVTTYPPGERLACYECALDPRQRSLQAAYPCDGGAPDVASTGSSAYLGALAAALQAHACERVLAGDVPERPHQVVVDAHHHVMRETTYAWNEECLLADHGPWSVTALARSAGEITVAEAFALGGGSRAGAGLQLGIEWGRLEIGAQCFECGHQVRGLRLRRHAPLDWGSCPACLGQLVAAGGNVVEDASLGDLDETVHDRSLRRVGIEARDIVRLSGPHGVSRFEVGAERRFER